MMPDGGDEDAAAGVLLILGAVSVLLIKEKK